MKIRVGVTIDPLVIPPGTQWTPIRGDAGSFPDERLVLVACGGFDGHGDWHSLYILDILQMEFLWKYNATHSMAWADVPESWEPFNLRYYCDRDRHLVCTPYSVENLHRMAEDLGIKRCWYHASSRFKHYDIPKRRIDEIKAKCDNILSAREILAICKGESV